MSQVASASHQLKSKPQFKAHFLILDIEMGEQQVESLFSEDNSAWINYAASIDLIVPFGNTA